MRAIVLLAFFVAAVTAVPTAYERDQRIIGGSLTTISSHPDMTALLYAANSINFGQECGGMILNQRSVLSAAQCFPDGRNIPSTWRFRVGSSFAHSGGVLHNVNLIIMHPNYIPATFDSDLAILRTPTMIDYSNNVAPAFIAGTNYNLGDNQIVWAAGWGWTEFGGLSEQLRNVQIWTVSQEICRTRYDAHSITDNMLCAGWLDVGGRDQCQGDAGGPLYHNGVVVGITSWGRSCALPTFPGVNVRVSRFTTWIQSNG